MIDGVRFIGTTLWADFDVLASLPPDTALVGDGPGRESLLTWQLRLRGKAFRAANHYLAKATTLRDGVPMLAEGMRDLSLDCQAWLRAALAVPFDGTTVAVTHFAPTLLSHDPRYGTTPGTAGFCNALDDLLPFADVWMHGHLHCPHDYVVPHLVEGVRRRCRVVANPMGYIEKALAGQAMSNDDEVPRAQLPFEYMLNALRLREGFALADFQARTGLPMSSIAAAVSCAAVVMRRPFRRCRDLRRRWRRTG